MKRGQVFVRARIEVDKRSGLEPTYRWVNADVLDLTEDSFRAFVIGILFRAGAVTGIKDEALEGEHIIHEIADEHIGKYLKELEKDDR